jgi:hypothetical protein
VIEACFIAWQVGIRRHVSSSDWQLIHSTPLTSHSRLQSSRSLVSCSIGPGRDQRRPRHQPPLTWDRSGTRRSAPRPGRVNSRSRAASHHPDRPIRLRLAIPAVHVRSSLLVYTSPVPPTTTALGLIGHVRGVINRATDAGAPKITTLPHANRSASSPSTRPPTPLPLLPRRGSTRSPAGALRQPFPPPARGCSSRLLAPARRERQAAAASFGAVSGSPRSPRFGCESKVIRRGARELEITAGLPLVGAQSRVGLGFLLISCRFGAGAHWARELASI